MVGRTVEKTLAPAHWHDRLPFYGKVVGENAVEARGNTQEVMDQEIAYAHTAGLDYWAFVIYPEEHALSLGLKLYLSSERKLLVNFCLDLQGGWEARGGPSAWPARIERYVAYFKEPTYQDVLGGRPLVYLYSVEGLVGPGRFETWEDVRTAFDQLRAAAQAAGVGNPYIVYAWNEFDEGGWICPTLSESSDRLDALRKVLTPKHSRSEAATR